MSARKVHFVGAGGVGMAALAWLLKERGEDVSGCDVHDSPRLRWLASQGVRTSAGHDPSHVADADAVVATPAADPELDELAEARRRGIPVRSRGEVLAEIVSSCDSVAVCGSHGKTTTATFTAKLLAALGENVAWAIGGETGTFPVAGRAGPSARPQVLVVEADESDGTLSLYRAKTLVVTNCEWDHPDHFKTFAEYKACFDAAKTAAGAVVEAQSLAPIPALDAVLAPLAPHNRANARAAAEVAILRGHSPGEIAKAMPSAVAELPDRRFQKIANPAGMDVYTDYAHHPTEMKCAVAMARERCRGTLRVIFQPHRYSRTKAFLKDFPAALESADEVVLCPVYAAFEKFVEGGDAADLYAEVRSRRPGGGLPRRILLARSCEEAWFHARASMKAGDLTLLLGAGDIIGTVPLVESWAPPPERRIWIGVGANTWKSDLATGEMYVKTGGPAGAPGASLGIPWMAGIPGTVGGWIKMNAGAFGHSISEALARVNVDGKWIDAADCGFGYRRSGIDGEIRDFELKPEFAGKRGTDAGGRDAAFYLAKRRKFPAGTWGSVFKNPPGAFAGEILERAGCKGLRVGGAHVWTEHANVIVCGEGSTASDALALARIMCERAYCRCGATLEPEVCGLESAMPDFGSGAKGGAA